MARVQSREDGDQREIVLCSRDIRRPRGIATDRVTACPGSSRQAHRRSSSANSAHEVRGAVVESRKETKEDRRAVHRSQAVGAPLSRGRQTRDRMEQASSSARTPWARLRIARTQFLAWSAVARRRIAVGMAAS
jgi:hypothetical protein